MLFLNSLSAALLAAFLSVAAADDTAILYKEIARNSNQSLLWGPYRPNLYFGVRPRIPKSLMGGLMWSKVDNFQDVQNSMWSCLFSDYCACLEHWDLDRVFLWG
jgi:mannosyl-oligosaccharide glucosidase